VSAIPTLTRSRFTSPTVTSGRRFTGVTGAADRDESLPRHELSDAVRHGRDNAKHHQFHQKYPDEPDRHDRRFQAQLVGELSGTLLLGHRYRRFVVHQLTRSPYA